jgi:hypothetical protein
LGNFRALLGEVARSPAMLYYLNNSDSIASPANENYARELLELHTLGAGNYLNDRYDDWKAVPGATEGLADGYLDLDVYEVARAFTGWSVGDGRWIAEGETAPRTGRFHYVARWHDPYQKRILGREFPPNRGPLQDGEEVLDILAAHPGTARFVCSKIARRLLSDDPPAALVEQMADRFLATRNAPTRSRRSLGSWCCRQASLHRSKNCADRSNSSLQSTAPRGPRWYPVKWDFIGSWPGPAGASTNTGLRRAIPTGCRCMDRGQHAEPLRRSGAFRSGRLVRRRPGRTRHTGRRR